ncbi:MAG: thioredoxin domain-containing protein [Bacteroidota bacterium]
MITILSCQKSNDSSNEHEYTNKLVSESSPYLLQHAHNPVDWYPWGDEALKKAKDENKLIVISIGYSSCHWCHVMEKESFEDTAVAGFMNEHFVSIKIDREERPDIDQIYMDAAILINGNGGWPLNIVTLPNTQPVFAGTYYAKDDWTKMLDFFQNLYQEDPEKLIKQAQLITDGINQIEEVPEPTKSEFQASDSERMARRVLQDIDFELGGKKGAPKFPIPTLMQFLMEQYYLTENDSLKQAVNTTLTQMAQGGIFDHLGGGFARYSTDPKWFAPHFEKMLYDNGQLVSLYSKAHQLFENDLYKNVVTETLDFISRELTSPEGGFYSSIDADSEGEEGKFYVWSKSEIDSLLDKPELFIKYYGVKEAGNWEPNHNILFVEESVGSFASNEGIDALEFETYLKTSEKKLFEARKGRIRPGTDDKILTSWNALMIKGYVDAYTAFQNDAYLESALKAGNFILENQRNSDGSLNRNYKDGKSSINAFLDDYTFTIEAFLSLYQTTFDMKWLMEAQKLTDYVIGHFSDEQSGMFFYTSSKDRSLIARKKELNDSVLPSSNSSMARNLMVLGTLLYNKGYLERSKKMLAAVYDDMRESPTYFNNWARLANMFTYPLYEVAIVGDDFESTLSPLQAEYIPNALFLGGETEGDLELLEGKLLDGRTMIYVCLNKACKLPTDDVERALSLIE